MVAGTDADAALVFYLSKADPLLVLRDLLGHSTVLTTEKYLRRLDTTRIYRQAYEGAGAAAGLAGLRGKPLKSSTAIPAMAGPDAGDGHRGAPGHQVRVQRRPPGRVSPGRPAQPASGP